MADNKEKKVVDLRERVTVYSTEKDPHHITGEPFSPSKAVAEKLVKKGLATEQPDSSTSKAKK